MSKDEALKIALQALKIIDEAMPFPVAKLAQSAIKEALAQPEQCQCPNCRVTLHASDCAVHNEPAYPKGQCNCGAQPAQQVVDSDEKAGAYMEARLWEFIDMAAAWPKASPDPRTWNHVVVYAPKPAQRTWVGLTDEEQTQVAWSCGAMSADWLDFARAIEAKLKEKNT